MTTKHRLAFRLSVVAALLGIVHWSGAQSRDGRGDGRTDARGTIKSVDAAAGTITVTFGGGRETAPTEKTYTLAKDVEICVGAGRLGGLFREAKLADLTPGTLVGLGLTADQRTVEAVIAEEPFVRGVLKAVDAKTNTLTVSHEGERGGEGSEKAYVLAVDAEITLDDGRGRRHSIREAHIDDLAGGANVVLRLSLDRKQARAVLAEGATVTGTVKALDAAKRSLTVTVRPARGEEAADERQLTVSPEALVVIDDGKGRRLSVKEAKLEGVPVGAQVTVKLATDQFSVMLLKAEGPTLTGLLKAVDPDKSSITIAIARGRGEEPDEKTLPVSKDARVLSEGSAAKLGDLKPGENGPIMHLRLSLDQRAVQIVEARQPGTR